MTIIKTFEIEKEQKRFPKKYIVLMIISLFILTLTEIWVNNTVIAYGDKFEKSSSLEKNLKMENQILENMIAVNSSLNVIASESAKLGFFEHQSIEYIR